MSKKLNQNKELSVGDRLYIVVGDIINAEFTYYIGTRVGESLNNALVIDVREGGWYDQNSVILTTLTDGVERSFNKGWVTKLVSRSSNTVAQAPFNCMSHAAKDLRNYNSSVNSNYYFGIVTSLAYAVASQFNFAIPHSIDEKKVYKLWIKSGKPGLRPGKVGSPETNFVLPGFYYIHKKKFTAWLKKNIFKLTYTTKELNIIAKEGEKQQEEWFEEDWDMLTDHYQKLDNILHSQNDYENDGMSSLLIPTTEEVATAGDQSERWRFFGDE